MTNTKHYQLYYTDFHPIGTEPPDARPIGYTFQARNLQMAVEVVLFTYSDLAKTRSNKEKQRCIS